MSCYAPKLDALLRCFDRGHLNSSIPTRRIINAIEPLFSAMAPIAPLRSNSEVKALWIAVPRGDISNYDSFESQRDYGIVDTYDEYLQNWHDDYPDELCWYRLVIIENYRKDGALNYRGVSFGDKAIISASFDDGKEEYHYTEDATVELCGLLVELVEEAICHLRLGDYNAYLKANLPYQFRVGVVRRSVLRGLFPEHSQTDSQEISQSTLDAFKHLLASGKNNNLAIGRLTSMTANTFFQACSIGFQACNLKTEGLSLEEQYIAYADGRDEGLTGRGHCLNEGPGIDYDDPDAWNKWYFDRSRGGGHPWEVIRGGNSTHVDLFVYHDRRTLEWKVRIGELTEEEAAAHPCGFYFVVSGKHRPAESVNFYTAISSAGLPVILSDADEILARFEATDYVGIVPHSTIPKYCESMFPEQYGKVIDFMHVYDEDIEAFGDEIEWLPIETVDLIEQS